MVCAWDLNLDLQSWRSAAALPLPKPAPTRFRGQTQAHTHWINDIALAHNNMAVVSASSDLLVKVWRPHGGLKEEEPATIGQHADYVKCVASPSQQADWVASGGLDRRIYLWDLKGGGKTLEIDVSGEEMTEKGSVYALSANHCILASGGPESTVRLWDPKTGKNITKFVGHTDNVRAILVNEAGDIIMTASSDQTVKVWSVTAGRCMHTLTMHNDSVWSLYSDDPDLGIFYSSDRSGLIVKTDVRGSLDDMDNGLSLAIAQENDGVSKGRRLRQLHLDGHLQLVHQPLERCGPRARPPSQIPSGSTGHPLPGALPRSGHAMTGAPPVTNGTSRKEIPLRSILRISNMASFPATLAATAGSDTNTLSPPPSTSRKDSDMFSDPLMQFVEPVHRLPEETIEGQFGLVKHKLLNDRRRVLTLDTAGEVLLWDLIQCKPIRKFGKMHLEDVEPGVNTLEAVAPWCSIDTSSGNLTVVLEPFNCFDAEMYADELILEEPVEFREDQRSKSHPKIYNVSVPPLLMPLSRHN